MGEVSYLKPSMPRAEVRVGFTPSNMFMRLMDSAVEGVVGVEAVIPSDRKTILVFSPNMDMPACRSAFAQWSKTVVRAIASLPVEDRASLEQLEDAPAINAMCAHSEYDH